MAVAGVLSAIFKLDTKDAEKSAQKLERTLGNQVKGALEGMGRSAGAAGGLLGKLGPAGLAASAGIGAAVAAAAAGVGAVINLGSRFTDLAAETSLSTDFLQKLAFAGGQTGVSLEAAAKAALDLQSRIGKIAPSKEVLDALGQLGLSLDELRGMNAEEQFIAVGSAIAGLKSPTEQAAAAMALMSEGGRTLLPLLRDDFAGLMQTAEDLGIVLDEELLVAGDKLGDNWELLKTVGAAFLAEAVDPLVGGLARLTTGMTEFVRESRSQLDVLQEQMEQQGQMQALLETGISAEEARAELARRGAEALREERDALREKAAAELAAWEEQQRAEAAEIAGAAATIQGMLADKDAAEANRELAKFLGVTKSALEEMHPAVLQHAQGMLAVAQEEERAARMAQFVEQSWRTSLGMAKEISIDFTEGSIEAFAVMNEEIPPHVQGVGDVAAAGAERMRGAFATFGLRTREEMQITLEKMQADFETINPNPKINQAASASQKPS